MGYLYDVSQVVVESLDWQREFIKDNREESVVIIASRLESDREEINALWDGYIFRLSLSQYLIITLENEARWYIRGKLTEATEVPNYLDYIYPDALKVVKPEAITIIH